MPSSTIKHPKQPADAPVEQPYVLGTGQEESVRLGLQHRLWSASAHELWERAGLQPGQTVMDLGCGPGHATIDIAQIVGPTGRVIAVDESPAFLKQLHTQAQSRNLANIDRVLGDVQHLGECIEQGKGTVDIAYARWVFCFLNGPERVVDGLAQLLRPGGKIVVQDYFNYERSLTLAPRREAFSRVVNAVAAAWRTRGGDTDVMAKLPGMVLARGFDVEHLDVVQRIARPGTTMWHWPNAFWKTFVPKLVETGYVTKDEYSAFEKCWDEAGKDPASFIQLPPVYELIAVKR